MKNITLLFLISLMSCSNEKIDLKGFWVNAETPNSSETITILNDTLAILNEQNLLRAEELSHYYDHEKGTLRFPPYIYDYHQFKLINDTLNVEYAIKYDPENSDTPKSIDELSDTIISKRWIRIIPKDQYEFYSSSLKCKITPPLSSNSKTLNEIDLKHASLLWVGKKKKDWKFNSFNHPSDFVIQTNDQFAKLEDLHLFVLVEAEPHIIEKQFVVISFDNNTPDSLKSKINTEVKRHYHRSRIFETVYDTISKKIGIKRLE